VCCPAQRLLAGSGAHPPGSRWTVPGVTPGRAAAHQPLLQCAPAGGAGTKTPFTLPIRPMGTATALIDKDSQLASQKLFEGHF